MKEKCYICCDLKSFYASVECVERGLDPMTTNLVVADKRRTDKTICLAVTPSLKAYSISGRARLFEVVQKVKEVNLRRQRSAPDRRFTGASWHDPEVRNNPSLALDYLVAPPRMAHYIDWSTKIYRVYLKYIAPEDIFPYSIDEVFMDVTNYLDTYKMTARELTQTILLDILRTTGITAAAGMGSNLYLAKIAMDIVSKHIQADRHGVRIAKLTEESYRRLLWAHRPLTDFWRVGKGYAGKLEANGLYTMGDIARCSIGKPTDYHNEELLYKLFGVNAEILIDHAWGWEPCTIADVKAYKPENKSIVSGQVLQYPYHFDKARLVVREMAVRLLKRSEKLTISGRTNTSARLMGFFSWMPSNEVQRLRATYACPPANTPPVKSMTTRLKVSPWLLCTVMAHARRTGYCVKVPSSSSSICFFSSLYL